jgi:hypothetical protein
MKINTVPKLLPHVLSILCTGGGRGRWREEFTAGCLPKEQGRRQLTKCLQLGEYLWGGSCLKSSTGPSI